MKLKKIFVFALSFACLLLSCLSVSASPINQNIGSDLDINSIDILTKGQYLIEERQYYDENDMLITEKFYSSVNPRLKYASGNGTFTNTKEVKYETGTISYYVSGYFTWDEQANTATVSSVQSGASTISGITNSGKNTTSGSNLGGVWPGKKYAYAEFTFTATNSIGTGVTFSTYIDVNVAGVSSKR